MHECMNASIAESIHSLFVIEGKTSSQNCSVKTLSRHRIPLSCCILNLKAAFLCSVSCRNTCRLATGDEDGYVVIQIYKIRVHIM